MLINKICELLFILIISINLSLAASVEVVDTSKNYKDPIGRYLQIFHEKDAPLNVSTALLAFNNKRFSVSEQKVISKGLGAQPIWLAFDVIHSGNTSVPRYLQIDNSWLDKLDVYFVRNNSVLEAFKTGDSLSFSDRVIDQRFFAFEHFFKPGKTTVLIRAESIDPMVLPLFFMDFKGTQKLSTLENYGYGFLYGIVFALLAYNFILYLALKKTAYLLYSNYLVSFLLLNISYTGHGFQWLWSEYPNWQQPLNPLLMIVCSVSGLAFACVFLSVQALFPTLYRRIVYACYFFIISGIFAAITGQQLILLLLAFSFTLIFSCMMAILGFLSVRKGNQSAKFFLLAAISAIIGAISTALAVWGKIPFNTLSFHAYEIGMVMDAILLAFALAKKIQSNDKEKYQALKLASTDPLTALNNRRAFYDLLDPVWEVSVRNNREVALMMIDIDKFKLLNDNYGHGYGDQALVLVAQTIKDEARISDIVARWGGEEFIVFLPETNLVNAINIADRIRQTIAALVMQVEQAETTLTVSLGVAHCTDVNDVSLDELISIADKRLYSAKEQGRNCVCSHG